MDEETEQRQMIELCRATSGDVSRLIPSIVSHIREEFTEYTAVPVDEHEVHVRREVMSLLAGLADRLPPTPSQIAQARALGRRRASQGVPVEAMIGAYHIGYGEMWNALLARAESYGDGVAERLVRLVNVAWTWTRTISAAAADAHGEETRSQHAVRVSLTHRFLDALRGGEGTSDEALLLCRALSYDPDGHFQAICAAAWPDDALDRLQRRADALPGTVHSATRGASTVVLFQDTPAGVVLATIRGSYQSGSPVGVGMLRPGLTGAEWSVIDAERALAVGSGTTFFEHEWLAASLSPQRRRLEEILRPGPTTAHAHPHLAEAVRAFADNGFSVSAAARALKVHPNTEKYRLDRWAELTGWNARTPEGLTKSLLSLRLFPA